MGKPVRVQVPPSTIKKSSCLGALFYWGQEDEEPILGVQRERAEAGVLLFEVMKSLKTKHGIAVTSERPRQVPPQLSVRCLFLFGFLFGLEPAVFARVASSNGVSFASTDVRLEFHILVNVRGKSRRRHYFF